MAHQKTSARSGEAVRIWMLGGFRVSVGNRVIEEGSWRRRKVGNLVKLLALAHRHTLHRERVAEDLWPGVDAKSQTNNLHRALHFARKALAPADIPLRDGMLSLYPDGPLWVDVEAFEDAAATARLAREPAAYKAAIDLYAGELLPEDRYEDWAEERREKLRTNYLALLAELAALHEEREEFDPAIEALREVVAKERTDEEAHLALMRLFALSGRSQQAALHYERLRKALSEDLGTKPGPETERLHEEIAAGRFPPERPGDRPSEEGVAGKHNLPASRTSFVGREREKLEVKRDLSMTRLLTLTGAGGAGKTRLAVEVAKSLVGAYPDGVWLVELAALSEDDLVPNAVAQALRIREQPHRPLADTLVESLRSRRMLLVFDNCEHLIEGCARLVDTLLAGCEHLRVLATSREALEVGGEVNWRVPSLAVPDTDDLPDVRTLAQYEAIRLFMERARSRLTTFELTPENAPAIANVCRKLDGIPLAIELATARMGALAAEQVAERLEDSLRLLTGGARTAEPRQQTLRATLDWSHDLLDEPERMLFGRLSVFTGGFSLEAAEEVCSGVGIGEDEVLDLLSKLVDKSLVVVEAGGDGAPRYRMLEPVRQYGREKLEEWAEVAEVRRRHAEHYVAFAETAEPELLGPDQGRWLRRLRVELGNMREAHSWSLGSGGEEERAQLGLRLAAALWRFWGGEGFEEGKRWLREALEKDLGGCPPARAKALGALGFILLFQQDYQRAIVALEEAIALHEDLGNASGAALALGNLGYAVLHGGFRERVPAFVEEGEALMARDLDGHARAFLRVILATAAIDEGDLDSAVSQLEESLALCRELGNARIASMALFTFGMTELKRDNLDRGAALLEESARIAGDLKDMLGIAYNVRAQGEINALRGKPVRAVKLWGAAEAFREQLGISPSPFDLTHSSYERELAAARSTLGEASFDAIWNEGRAMSPDRAIEYALSKEEPAPPVASVPEEATPSLSRRQREVALLIARGLTNRQIANELLISERTVTTHVDHIRNKLRAASRSQIAAWVVEQRPLPEENPA